VPYIVLRIFAAFLFLGVCSAGTAPDPFRPDLKRTLETWQQKLHLEDWTVAIEVVDNHTLGGQAMGDIHWNLTARTASIRILRERDYDLPARKAQLDQQATVLHELLHLAHASNQDQDGADEASVVRQTNELLRVFHEWKILAVQEQ
jgi:hypothetical protein